MPLLQLPGHQDALSLSHAKHHPTNMVPLSASEDTFHLFFFVSSEV